MAAKGSEKPLLAPVEVEMMRVLWRHGPGTVHDVRGRLKRRLAYTSVLTMLRILEQKGFLKRLPHPDGGRSHVYEPTVDEQSVRERHVRVLVDRMFDGQPEQLLTGILSGEDRLSRSDLERLRALIDRRLQKGARKVDR